MKQFKFNEQAAIEGMIRARFVDKSNVVNTIYSLAKYNYHILGLNDKVNYNHVLKYITDNCENVFEEGIYKDIEGCIKSAKRHTLSTINEVCITQSELDAIKKLNDIKQEKAMFVLLAVSKYFNLLNNKDYDAVFLTNTDICKLARITIPAKDRDQFMQFAYDKELLHRHTWSNSTIKKVTFVSHDENDKVVLKLNEGDFKDLAYTYLAYISPSQFRRCVTCGKWIRCNKQDRRLCLDCGKNTESVDEKDIFKAITCVDCGKTAYVSVLNKKEIERSQMLFANKVSRSISFEKIMPIIPAGMVAKTKHPNNLKGFLKTSKICFHKTIITGTSVPK